MLWMNENHCYPTCSSDLPSRIDKGGPCEGGARRPPQRGVTVGKNQIRWRAIGETPRVNWKGRRIIKEVCSELTHPLCWKHLLFAVSCSLVTDRSVQFYSHGLQCAVITLHQEGMNGASVPEKSKYVRFSLGVPDMNLYVLSCKYKIQS